MSPVCFFHQSRRFAYGGGPSMIPLIQEEVVDHNAAIAAFVAINFLNLHPALAIVVTAALGLAFYR